MNPTAHEIALAQARVRTRVLAALREEERAGRSRARMLGAVIAFAIAGAFVAYCLFARAVFARF